MIYGISWVLFGLVCLNCELFDSCNDLDFEITFDEDYNDFICDCSKAIDNEDYSCSNQHFNYQMKTDSSDVNKETTVPTIGVTSVLPSYWTQSTTAITGDQHEIGSEITEESTQNGAIDIQEETATSSLSTTLQSIIETSSEMNPVLNTTEASFDQNPMITFAWYSPVPESSTEAIMNSSMLEDNEDINEMMTEFPNSSTEPFENGAESMPIEGTTSVAEAIEINEMDITTEASVTTSTIEDIAISDTGTSPIFSSSEESSSQNPMITFVWYSPVTESSTEAILNSSTLENNTESSEIDEGSELIISRPEPFENVTESTENAFEITSISGGTSQGIIASNTAQATTPEATENIEIDIPTTTTSSTTSITAPSMPTTCSPLVGITAYVQCLRDMNIQRN